MKHQDIIANWLNENKLMQLSTAVNDQPWLCTVGFVSDENFNIYWFSRTDRRHSKEVLQNSKVAATIVHDPRGRQAIQLIGTATRLPAEDLEMVHALYVGKLGFQPAKLEDLQTSDEISFWVLKPSMIATWDEVNSRDNPKQEYDLNA